jgi:hypothetical protein
MTAKLKAEREAQQEASEPRRSLRVKEKASEPRRDSSVRGRADQQAVRGTSRAHFTQNDSHIFGFGG